MIYDHPQDAFFLDDMYVSNHFSEWFATVKNGVNRGELPATTQKISATRGILLPSQTTNIIIRIEGDSAGTVDITANPQIERGFDGQQIILEGMSDTSKVKIDQGDGLFLKSASITLGNNETASFHYNEAKQLWIQQ